MALQVHDFLTESSCYQIINKDTRIGSGLDGQVCSAILDHCYTNVPEKIKETKVVCVGSSDHMGIVVKKLAKTPASRPQTLRKRSYKEFDIASFLTQIYLSDINSTVTAIKSLNEAAEMFEKGFRAILDNHAPMKIIQIRKNYIPYLSHETKIFNPK